MQQFGVRLQRLLSMAFSFTTLSTYMRFKTQSCATRLARATSKRLLELEQYAYRKQHGRNRQADVEACNGRGLANLDAGADVGVATALASLLTGIDPSTGIVAVLVPPSPVGLTQQHHWAKIAPCHASEEIRRHSPAHYFCDQTCPGNRGTVEQMPRHCPRHNDVVELSQRTGQCQQIVRPALVICQYGNQAVMISGCAEIHDNHLDERGRDLSFRCSRLVARRQSNPTMPICQQTATR